uniref:Uncharacterized protein n=1 Tax=Panagrolaimus sp. ES5 TaxID=591445 RepID=A0AC34FPF5_9BILA
MKLRSGKIISKPDVDITDLTIDNIPSTSSKPNAIYTFMNPRRQSFSLPYPIMKYITMSPTSYKAWRKLITTCKYFYSRNLVIPIRSCENYTDYEWSVSWTPGKYKLIDLRKINFKLWLHGYCQIRELYPILNPKVFRYDLNNLFFSSRTVSYDEYSMLTSTATLEGLIFLHVNVIYYDGSPVAFDKLLKNLSNTRKINFHIKNLHFAPDTVEKMDQMLPNFHKLSMFSLSTIPKTFNPAGFTKIVKKYPQIQFLLQFDQTASNGYKKKVRRLQFQRNNVRACYC